VGPNQSIERGQFKLSNSNSVRTRNARLAAIHSLYSYAALAYLEHVALIARVLAIPAKRHERALVTYLTRPEIEALLAAPDLATWLGRRDRTLLVVAVQTGLRVSELTGLSVGDVRLGAGAHVRCHGKGRKERITPLTRPTAKVLKSWLGERKGVPEDPLLPTATGTRLSREAVGKLVAKHVLAASGICPSLRSKAVSPHTLRHTAAMELLRAGVDTTVIALWLGHEQVATTSIYLHADLSIKERAIAKTTPLDMAPGRFRPTDGLLAFLEAL
jgi:integrase/recombinase XerD